MGTLFLGCHVTSNGNTVPTMSYDVLRVGRGYTNMLYLCVSEVTATSVKLQSGDVLPCGLVVWSTGLAPRHFTRSLDVDKNARGQVSDHCRSE